MTTQALCPLTSLGSASLVMRCPSRCSTQAQRPQSCLGVDGLSSTSRISSLFRGRALRTSSSRSRNSSLLTDPAGTLKSFLKEKSSSPATRAVPRSADVSINTLAVIIKDDTSDSTPLQKQHLTTEEARDVSRSIDSGSNGLKDSHAVTSPSQSWGPFAWMESRFSPRVRGLILLNILTLLYGSNVTVVKEAQAALDPFTFSLGRFGIAALAFTPFLRPAFQNPAVFRAGVELGIWASLAYVTQAVGLMTTEAGRAAFIGTFTVIEVPIIAGILGARIPVVTWWAAAAAVGGVALLESAGGNSSPMGDFWTIMSALIFGFHMLRSEHHARHVPADSALSLIALQLFVTGVMSLGWLVGMSQLGLVEESSLHAMTTLDWGTISSWPWLQMTYTGVLSTAFCLWVEVVSLRDVSASEAAMVYTLEPLYGAGFAWVLLGERWGPMGWAGAGLILGGSLTMQLFGRVESPEDEPEEIESQKSSAAILAALGAAAAIALVMAASGLPGEIVRETVPEGIITAEAVAWSAYSDMEIDNLVTFMRAYAMVKGDEPSPGDGGVEASTSSFFSHLEG